MFQEGVEKAVDKLGLFSPKNLVQNFLTENRVLHIKCATNFLSFSLVSGSQLDRIGTVPRGKRNEPKP